MVGLFTSQRNLLVQGEEKQMAFIFQILATGKDLNISTLLTRSKITQKLTSIKVANEFMLFLLRDREVWGV